MPAGDGWSMTITVVADLATVGADGLATHVGVNRS
jgi:hypothetical protein